MIASLGNVADSRSELTAIVVRTASRFGLQTSTKSFHVIEFEMIPVNPNGIRTAQRLLNEDCRIRASRAVKTADQIITTEGGNQVSNFDQL
jgi:hypothetical protein